MVRTQVQLPDELYTRAKRLAEHREISLTELVRRGLETILAQYPAPTQTRTTWRIPQALVGKTKVALKDLGAYASDDEALRSLVAEDPES